MIFIQTKLINYVANWDPLLLRTFNFVKNQLMNKTFQCAKLINYRCIWLSNNFFSNRKIFTLFFPGRSRIVLSSQNNSIEIKEKNFFLALIGKESLFSQVLFIVETFERQLDQITLNPKKWSKTVNSKERKMQKIINFSWAQIEFTVKKINVWLI